MGRTVAAPAPPPVDLFGWAARHKPPAPPAGLSTTPPAPVTPPAPAAEAPTPTPPAPDPAATAPAWLDPPPAEETDWDEPAPGYEDEAGGDDTEASESELVTAPGFRTAAVAGEGFAGLRDVDKYRHAEGTKGVVRDPGEAAPPPPDVRQVNLFGTDLFGNPVEQRKLSLMAQRFLVPPFSVLDARQGYWMERKRAWHALGFSGGEGREHLASTVVQNQTLRDGTVIQRGADRGGSLFDPVLCELAYRWFCLPGGAVLDPFAGGASRGVVAACLGYNYTGIELRPEQVAANREQAARLGVAPNWIRGDSAQLETLLPPGERYDSLFTCPPYYDLEVYSDRSGDGSALPTYDKFMEWYAGIFAAACARLRPNRFCVVVVGEIRDKRTGAYRNFVGDNIAVFRRLGLAYYNEAVLLTPVGSMPLRAGKAFTSSRKLCKGHQSVLVFWKGDPRAISKVFPHEGFCTDGDADDDAATGGQA